MSVGRRREPVGPRQWHELVGRRRECAALDGLLRTVLARGSQALVVHGEPGVGKTVLLDYLASRAPSQPSPTPQRTPPTDRSASRRSHSPWRRPS